MTRVSAGPGGRDFSFLIEETIGMNSLESLATFFGWCTVLNYGLLILIFIFVTTMRGTMTSIHSRLFGVSEADLPRCYFQVLAHYQTLILAFSLTPYIALKLMA